MPCESSKIKRINTRREQNRRFYSDIILQVREKSAILRFKAKDEALSSALKSDGHKHFVIYRFLFFRDAIHFCNCFSLSFSQKGKMICI